MPDMFPCLIFVFWIDKQAAQGELWSNAQKSRRRNLNPKAFQDHLHGREGQILLAGFQCVAESGIDANSPTPSPAGPA